MELREVSFTHNLESNVEVMRRHGLLLTSADSDGKPNVMTIGWGNPGFIWGKPVFIVLVRPSRFTFGNIEETMQFVVSVPGEDLHEACLHCGTVSGRDYDKFADCGFTLRGAGKVGVPLIDQCMMHYECRVAHVNDVVESQLDADLRKGCYPEGDFHRIYYGEILRTTAGAG